MPLNESAAFIGIDVSEKRGFAVALIGRNGEPLDTIWLPSENPKEISNQLGKLLANHTLRLEDAAIGIDAPRQPLPTPRKWNWDGNKRQWQPLKTTCSGFGRHCEIIIKAHNLANPQWTPTLGQCPGWMQIGFTLFENLSRLTQTVEVFPSASYNQLEHADFRLEVMLDSFNHGPKDMLDAFVAAATTRESRHPCW